MIPTYILYITTLVDVEIIKIIPYAKNSESECWTQATLREHYVVLHYSPPELRSKSEVLIHARFYYYSYTVIALVYITGNFSVPFLYPGALSLER